MSGVDKESRKVGKAADSGEVIFLGIGLVDSPLFLLSSLFSEQPAGEGAAIPRHAELTSRVGTSTTTRTIATMK